MIRNSGAFFFSMTIPLMPLGAHEIVSETGTLTAGDAPAVDYAALAYRSGGYRVGVFTAPNRRGVLASYSGTHEAFVLDLGQRERSFEQGFIVGNGAYLPWTRNFAFAEPAGARVGLRKWIFAADLLYYQLARENLMGGQFSLAPVAWFKLCAGASGAVAGVPLRRLPFAGVSFGAADGSGFFGGLQYAGDRNGLIHARYVKKFTVRGLLFTRSDENPLASGVYAGGRGGVLQWISRDWFIQFFEVGRERPGADAGRRSAEGGHDAVSTPAGDTRFGMVRYGGGLLTALAIYEDKMQLAGISLRNSATGLHFRSGLTIAADSSLQTLLGFGYADFLFVGAGHYELKTDEPLEPLVFPSEWYSSVLLQSSNMRVQDRGFKMLALVDTEVAKGFFGVTYSESGNRREQFGFYMRLSGGVVF